MNPEDPGPGHPAGGSRARTALVALAAAVFAVDALRYRFDLVDDAYISLRYARNLTLGHGLVFNPGERVEGYTNLLWTLYGALALRVGADGMAVWQWTSLLATLALLAVTVRLEGEGPRGVPALAFLLGVEATGYWATTGMETMAFTLLVTLGVALTVAEARDGRGGRSVLVFLAAALTRPEGALVGGLALGAATLAERLAHGRWPLARRARDLGLLALAPIALTAWRRLYYGDWVPNTFHAKVTGSVGQVVNGFTNLGEWAISTPASALALAAGLAMLAHPSGRRPERVVVLGVAAGYVAYVVAVGGDFMPFLRFFLSVSPLLAVLASWITRDLQDRWPRAGLAGIGLVVAQVAASHLTDQPCRAFVAHRTAQVGLEVGAHLGDRLTGDDLVACNTVGALPWRSGLPTLDMLGLTDAEVARHPVFIASAGWAGHERGYGEYVRRRRPAIVMFYNSAGLDAPHYLGDRQLADQPYFRFFYQLRRISLPPPEAEGASLAWFAGTPFGARGSASPDLGVAFEVEGGRLPWTVARSRPIDLVTFERRRDRDALWPLALEGRPVAEFVAAVADAWARRPLPPADPAAQGDVEALCAQALAAWQGGDRERAHRLLDTAVARNARARSPVVYQAVARVAGLERDVFLAAQAQAEALRLDPARTVYREGLVRLLTVPYRRVRPEAAN